MWQFTLYIPVLLISGLISVSTALVIWRRRTVRGAPALSLLCATIGLWAFGYSLELSTTILDRALLFARFEYIEIVFVPLIWLVFAASYTGYDAWLTRPRLLALILVITLNLTIFWTTELHRLFWSDVVMVPQAIGISILTPTYGPWFWIHVLCSYGLLVAGTSILIGAIVRSPNLYRNSLGALLVAGISPWLANVIYLFDLSPFGSLDLTPIGFSVTGISIAWAMLRYRLLDIVPIARGTIFEQMNDGVIVLDNQNQVVDINPAAVQALDVGPGGALGRPVHEVFAAQSQLVDRYLESFDIKDEVELSDDTGQHWYDIRISPIYSRRGTLQGRLIVWRDITQIKQVEAALLEAKDAAERASQAKSVFLANMSHELRTPLSAIMGYCQLTRLEHGDTISAGVIQNLGVIESSGDHLLRMITNLLQMAQIETGMMQLYIEDVEIDPIIEQVVDLTRPLIARKGNALQLHLAKLGIVRGDGDKIRQVLLNLIDNAAKFTENGLIALSAERIHHLEGIWVQIKVHDNGVGITPGEIPHLFTMFSDLDPEKRRRFGGTGVGLATSQYFCQQMGGDIGVSSTPGVGTTFTVRLPAVSGA